jgi:hypothetical protein
MPRLSLALAAMLAVQPFAAGQGIYPITRIEDE